MSDRAASLQATRVPQSEPCRSLFQGSAKASESHCSVLLHLLVGGASGDGIGEAGSRTFLFSFVTCVLHPFGTCFVCMFCRAKVESSFFSARPFFTTSLL